LQFERAAQHFQFVGVRTISVTSVQVSSRPPFGRAVTCTLIISPFDRRRSIGVVSPARTRRIRWAMNASRSAGSV
jgi:hypothetical protein